MEKPLSLRIKELKINLARTVQEAELPAYLCVEAVDNLCNQIKRLADEQTQMEEAEYNEKVKDGE